MIGDRLVWREYGREERIALFAKNGAAYVAKKSVVVLLICFFEYLCIGYVDSIVFSARVL